jgi:phosphoglycerate dehydrogenase-like enzyme
MGMIVLSMAPLPGELVAAFIRQTPGVPEFEVIAGHEMADADLRDAAGKADVILGDFTFRRLITAEIVAAAQKVTLIQQPSVGYQHIDVEACTARGIRVANTAGANTESVAEHTVAWGLCLLKNMFYAHTVTRQGRWEQMGVKPAELRGRVWGLVGFGRIGRAVAERLKPFALRSLLYYDVVRPGRTVEETLGAEYRELGELLSASDVVSLHAPLTEATRDLIDRKALAAMKQGAFLINVSRAELVDEEALADALARGRIAGAGIDVFSAEPISPGNPLLKVESDRLLLSPHVAGVSQEAAGRIITMAAANIARALKGEPPESQVNTV